MMLFVVFVMFIIAPKSTDAVRMSWGLVIPDEEYTTEITYPTVTPDEEKTTKTKYLTVTPDEEKTTKTKYLTETWKYFAGFQVQVIEKKYAAGIFFKANWFRAAQYCRFHGMRLASVENDEEEKELESAVERLGFDIEFVWIAGTDYQQEGEFFWISDGKPITYTKWGLEQPNGQTDQNCIALHKGNEGYSWYDIVCSQEFHFICEYNPTEYNSHSRNYTRFV